MEILTIFLTILVLIGIFIAVGNIFMNVAMYFFLKSENFKQMTKVLTEDMAEDMAKKIYIKKL